jgi:hypothetical protein
MRPVMPGVLRPVERPNRVVANAVIENETGVAHVEGRIVVNRERRPSRCATDRSGFVDAWRFLPLVKSCRRRPPRAAGTAGPGTVHGRERTGKRKRGNKAEKRGPRFCSRLSGGTIHPTTAGGHRFTSRFDASRALIIRRRGESSFRGVAVLVHWRRTWTLSSPLVPPAELLPRHVMPGLSD